MPLLGRGAWSPSNTKLPGPRPTSIPSFILIHPTVWTQYINVKYRTDRQTDIIRRTVLRTVGQKRNENEKVPALLLCRNDIDIDDN